MFLIRPRIFQYRIVFFFIALFIQTVELGAQELDDIHFEEIDDRNGLSNHWITDIQLDRSGFLWIATRDGLNRYDGFGFKIFKHNEHDKSSLLFDNIQSLWLDDFGRICLSYDQHGFSVYDSAHQNFTHYDSLMLQGKNITSEYFCFLHRDQNQGIWFSNRGRGLCYYHPVSGVVKQFDIPYIDPSHTGRDPFGMNTAVSLYAEPGGPFWITCPNGLYSFDTAKSKFTYYPCPIQGDRRVDCFGGLRPAGNEGFWLYSTAGGLTWFNRKEKRFTNYLFNRQSISTALNNTIYSISFRNPKEIWVCTSDSGLGVFHIPSGTFRFRKQREEGEKNATKLIQSRQGVWFLLSSNRLFRYNPQNDLFHFEKMDVANTQSRTPLQIRRILSDPDYHALYMATDIGKGLVIYDSVRHQLISLPVETHPLSGDEFMRVWDIQKDAQNRYWVLSRDYIYELDRKNKKLKRLNTLFVQPARKYPTHKNFIRDQQQHLFVLSEDGHLFPLLPEEKMVTAWPVLPGQPSRILQAAFDLQNRCWILGPDSLGYLNPERTKFTLLSNPDLKIFQTNGINGFQSLQDGSIWISSLNKGLLKLWIDSAGHVQTKVWNMENGLPTQRIFSLKSDDKGNLWIPTVLGLVVLNPQTRQAQVYNHRNGIDRSSLQPMCSQAGPGIFYLSTEGKICQVNYHKLQDVSDSPQVYFYNFRVFNEERLLSRDEITLQPGENFFSIEFSCLDFLNQNRHNFSYQLIGWDKDWVSCGNRRYASYTNLNGGDYIFRVRVATPDGVWSKIRELKVHILTPFYKKNWFAAALIFIFAFVVFMLYLYRVRSIENTEKLKTEFNRQLAESRMAALRAQMNPHFIFNCLNSINRYVIKSEIKTASLYLTRFARLIRLILDNSENKFVVLSNELEALRLYIEMESLRFDQRFTFDIHVEENIETDQIEIPPLLIQPFVENAIWHGLLHRESEGHLQINLRLDDPFLVCEIIDNGIGREKAKEYKSKTAPTRKSLGMKLTEERLKMNSGPDSGSQKIVDLKDEHGLATGTMVILHIPI